MRKHCYHQDLPRIPIQANQSAKEHDSRTTKQRKLSPTSTIQCENTFESGRNELKHKLLVTNGFSTESCSRSWDLHEINDLNSNNSNSRSDGDMLDTMKALLTCAVCLEVRNQTNQCANGHLICAQCSIRLIQQTQSKPALCPTCRIPLQFRLRRCLLAEQMVAEIPTQCHYCQDKFTRRSIRQHELENCPKRPVLCRFNLVGCNWKGCYSELFDHINLCTYKQLTVRDVESTLVSKIRRYETSILDGIQFCRSLLQKLSYNPSGLKITTREIGVFREPNPNDDRNNSETNCYVYQASNVNLSLSSLRRLSLEVRLDYANSKLDYCFKTKSDRSVEFCLRLGLVRCGDFEISVDDQLHTIHFDSNRKETPVYVVNLNLNYTPESEPSPRDTFDRLPLRDGLTSLEAEFLNQTTDLVLDFIILTEQPEQFQFRFGNGSNQDYSSELLDTNDTNSQPLNLRMRFERTDDLDDSISGIPSNANSTSETGNPGLSWRQLLTSPTGALLRPFLGSLFPNSGSNRTTGNNNAPDVGTERPYSIVLTLTNLSGGETRDELIPTEQDEATSRSSTEEEEEEEEEDGDDDEEENASDDESESEQEAEVVFETNNANNNAIDEEQSGVEESKSSDSSVARLGGNLKKPMVTFSGQLADEESGSGLNQARADSLNSNNTEQMLTTNVSSSLHRQVPQKQLSVTFSTGIGADSSPQKPGRRKRKNSRLNTNANSYKEVPRPKSPARQVSGDYSPRRKRVQRSRPNVDGNQIPETEQLESPISPNPSISGQERENTNMPECRMPTWLRGLVTAVAGLSRYMVRSHVVPETKDTADSAKSGTNLGSTVDSPCSSEHRDMQLKEVIGGPCVFEAEEPVSSSPNYQLSSSELIDEAPSENPSLAEPVPETTKMYPIQTEVPNESMGLASHELDVTRQDMELTEVQTTTMTTAEEQSEVPPIVHSDCILQRTSVGSQENILFDASDLDRTIYDSNLSNSFHLRSRYRSRQFIPMRDPSMLRRNYKN